MCLNQLFTSTQHNVNLSYLKRLMVCSIVWIAATTTVASNSDCVEKPQLFDAEMPNLSMDQRTLVIDAFYLNRHEPHPTCSFELDATLDYIPSRIERYDPELENDSPWTLISVEDREPRERERKQTPRYTRMSPEEVFNDLAQNTLWESLTVANENDSVLTLEGLKNLEVGSDEFVSADFSLDIDKTTRSIAQVRIAMKEPRKINFAATISEMEMTQIYRYEPRFSRVFLDQLLVDWKFRFFLVRVSSTERITYRDYDCALANQTRICTE